uniref:DNA damage-binding protein 2 n=1 Tax=Magallana gigas TaxID=29159 RepID=K1QP20_MAGGI
MQYISSFGYIIFTCSDFALAVALLRRTVHQISRKCIGINTSLKLKWTDGPPGPELLVDLPYVCWTRATRLPLVLNPASATWHPLLDLAVIGRYPDPNFAGYHENELRTIDIIDVDSEKVVARLHDPSAPGLVCVNKFNPAGDTLLSGMGK